MCVESEHRVDNWVRAARRRILARTAAAELRRCLHAELPELVLPSSEPAQIEALNGQGWSNLAMKFQSPAHGRLIIRLSPVERTALGASTPTFEKERAVLALLPPGLPVPQLVAPSTGRVVLYRGTGLERSFAYIIQRELPGRTARELASTLDRAAVLRSLGEFTAVLHRTQAPGFGFTFDAERGCFSFGGWSEFLAERIRDLNLPGLRDAGLIAVSCERWLSKRLRSLAELRPESRLCHRDLLGNWGNILLDERGDVSGVIDWEYCGGCPAFHYEIASMLYVLIRDGVPQGQVASDLAAVLKGYGMSERRYRAEYGREIDSLVLMNALSALHKFNQLSGRGGLAEEPWRRTFAQRASALIRREFGADSRRQRVPGRKQRDPVRKAA